MKFKSPDGRVFDSIDFAINHYCEGNCNTCPLCCDKNGKIDICLAYKKPIEAARLMGYEVIEEKPEQEAKADHIKKHLYQGHDLPCEKIVEELGDMMWYIALTADLIGRRMEDIMQANIDKLWYRYPEGFRAEDSIHRKEEGQEHDISGHCRNGCTMGRNM